MYRRDGKDSRVSRAATRQRADRALARPRAVISACTATRRLQPTPRPTRRRRHPLHPRTCHRTAVLAVARLAIHRPLPAEQRLGRPGPPRLGVPHRRPHASPHAVRIWLVYRTIRHAARDVVSLRGSASTSSTCRTPTANMSSNSAAEWLPNPPSATVPADRRFLRDAPALSARPLRTRDADGVGVPDYLPDTATSGRTSPSSTAPSPSPTPLSADCSTPSPTPGSTAPPGWCS